MPRSFQNSHTNTPTRLLSHDNRNPSLPPRHRYPHVRLRHLCPALRNSDRWRIGPHGARWCRSSGLGLCQRWKDQQAHRRRQEDLGLHVQEPGTHSEAFVSHRGVMSTPFSSAAPEPNYLKSQQSLELIPKDRPNLYVQRCWVRCDF